MEWPVSAISTRGVFSASLRMTSPFSTWNDWAVLFWWLGVVRGILQVKAFGFTGLQDQPGCGGDVTVTSGTLIWIVPMVSGEGPVFVTSTNWAVSGKGRPNQRAEGAFQPGAKLNTFQIGGAEVAVTAIWGGAMSSATEIDEA